MFILSSLFDRKSQVSLSVSYALFLIKRKSEVSVYISFALYLIDKSDISLSVSYPFLWKNLRFLCLYPMLSFSQKIRGFFVCIPRSLSDRKTRCLCICTLCPVFDRQSEVSLQAYYALFLIKKKSEAPLYVSHAVCFQSRPSSTGPMAVQSLLLPSIVEKAFRGQHFL